MAHELHLVLAAASTMAVLLVALDGLRRALRGVPAGPRSARLFDLSLVLLVITSASGLGLLVGGGRPRELYHLMYGGFALMTLPVVGAFGPRARDRGYGAATAAGALFALVVIARLFATG
ncbi:MAG TPA: hypothetical protein VFU72_11990 [Nitrolancea sp.]|nr:hypothetical protein [Nitrolancea sp.]